MSLPDSGKHVYLMGIGGIGMANVALILREDGWSVSGSDASVYEPAASLLEKSGITPLTPYRAANVPRSSVPIIVGNAQSRGHVEVEAALNSGASLYSFPEFLTRKVIGERRKIVVAGTHGKSTTTAMVSHCLTECGLNPGFLIGAQPLNFPTGGRLGSDPYFVIEGDEYDSAFFDKRSKFLHYFPNTLVLGPVEFDHADIFANIGEVCTAFRRLIRLLPQEGLLVYDHDSPLACELADEAMSAKASVGQSDSCDWRLLSSAESLRFRTPDGNLCDWEFSIPGRYNHANALRAIAACHHLSGGNRHLETAITTYRGLKRRLELLHHSPNLKVYDDFAHHPTAIAATLDSVREQYRNARLVAVIEPRSNTMVRNVFQREVALALRSADQVILGDIHRIEKIPVQERFDFDALTQELSMKGIPVTHVPTKEIPLHLVKNLTRDSTVVVFMSNGAFGNAAPEFVRLIASEVLPV